MKYMTEKEMLTNILLEDKIYLSSMYKKNSERIDGINNPMYKKEIFDRNIRFILKISNFSSYLNTLASSLYKLVKLFPEQKIEENNHVEIEMNKQIINDLLKGYDKTRDKNNYSFVNIIKDLKKKEFIGNIYFDTKNLDSFRNSCISHLDIRFNDNINEHQFGRYYEYFHLYLQMKIEFSKVIYLNTGEKKLFVNDLDMYILNEDYVGKGILNDYIKEFETYVNFERAVIL